MKKCGGEIVVGIYLQPLFLELLDTFFLVSFKRSLAVVSNLAVSLKFFFLIKNYFVCMRSREFTKSFSSSFRLNQHAQLCV